MGTNGTQARQINAKNVSVGWHNDANNVQQGFSRRVVGNFAGIAPKGAAGSTAEDINDNGVIMGVCADKNGVFTVCPGTAS